jgi:hypothetical protein
MPEFNQLGAISALLAFSCAMMISRISRVMETGLVAVVGLVLAIAGSP